MLPAKCESAVLESEKEKSRMHIIQHTNLGCIVPLISEEACHLFGKLRT